MKQKPLVLIPAAGFGVRVGSPEAKELLLGPGGRPLIDAALNQAKARGWPVHVITRGEKSSLIAYLESFKGVSIRVQVIEPSREWPDTVLKSEDYWHEKNLLCLPDTIYSPESIWDRLVSSSADLAAGVFGPQDFAPWGVMRQAASGYLEICEKPRDFREGMKAWGLMCFKKQSGRSLLTAQLESTFDHGWR